MRKRIAALLLALALSLSVPAWADGGYRDVPEGSWAAESIARATDLGLINGLGGGLFGYGEPIRRGEFVTLLVRLLRWDTADTAAAGAAAFTDVSAAAWYAPYIGAALANGVVEAGGAFRPNEAITRRDMAVFFVRALGYGDLAAPAAAWSVPFTDLDADRGYITVAYDLGLVNGMTGTTFFPDGTATREQAAAMLVRAYDKYYQDTGFLHGFYAISSYSQLSLTGEMDAVSAGWSRMTLDGDGQPALLTTSAGGNEYCVPSGCASVTETLKEQGTRLHLSVYMDTGASFTAGGVSTNTLYALLADPALRTKAVAAITAELERVYPDIGRNPYDGVTIDFEGLRGEAVRENFTAFLTELSIALRAGGKTLYVAVQPALDGAYFDGFDYRAIGRLADKVILMAHDYSPTSLEGFVGSTYYRNAALTPLSQVYYSLRCATDRETGVEDTRKLVLAISCSAMAWEIGEDGLLESPDPTRPTTDTVYRRMGQEDTVFGWSETYRNPYLIYRTEEGRRIFLWYENGRSVAEKARLARLFGITGVSVWRLGLIPHYADAGLDYDVMGVLAGGG